MFVIVLWHLEGEGLLTFLIISPLLSMIHLPLPVDVYGWIVYTK